MSRILVPIDPTQPAQTRSAIEQVLRFRGSEELTVNLLRVQPEVSGHVAMFFGTDQLRELQEVWGHEELEAAEKLLDAAGVAYTSTVRVGATAATIVATAREQGCARIVFGAVEPTLAGRVFGSLAQQVRQLLGSRKDFQVLGS